MIFALILNILGVVAGWASFGWGVYEKVQSAFMTVIANSKLFVTIFLLGVSVAVWYFMNSSMNRILSGIMGFDNFSASVDSSFLSNFCTPSLLVTFVYNVVSTLITYYVVFASGLGYSIIVKLHAMASRSIVV